MKKIHLIGNAHLDPVWLWRWQEGFAEIKATFRSALDRMKEFDDFIFTSACGAYYMWIEKSDPEMFKEIQARVKEGRWCLTGGWLIQPDCNLPSGESFARHALITQRYFLEKFGKKAITGYNVDSFGHNGSLPKILRASGMENYVFMRPDKNEKELPASLFNWRSSDGSEVKTYRIPIRYGIEEKQFEEFFDIADMNESTDLMAFYGVGNHGGGPTVSMLNKMHAELGENFVYSSPDLYFAEQNASALPTVEDDLQYHAKGCYSASSEIKRNNGYSEGLLGAAEALSTLSGALVGTEYPTSELRRAWCGTLFNQFHDILGGCSIKEAYDDARLVHGEALAIAERSINYAIQQISWNIDTVGQRANGSISEEDAERIGIPLVVFNPHAREVSGVVFMRALFKLYGSVTDKDGNPVPTQKIRDSKTNCCDDKYATAILATVPPLGYTTYYFHKAECEKTFDNPFTVTDTSIENALIRIKFNKENGEITSIIDKRQGNELLAAETGITLLDDTKHDTWAHGVPAYTDVVDVDISGSASVTECGPVRATVRTVHTLGNSKIIRDYSILPDTDTVTVSVKVDFREEYRILKFTFPVNVKEPFAKCGIPYGSITRANNGDEHVFNDWIAMTDGGSSGLSVSTDSKHSFDAVGNELRLTVLRSCAYADHFGDRDEYTEVMEQGITKFSYTLSPFTSPASAVKAASELISPLVAVPETFHKGKLPEDCSGISISAENLCVTAVKRSESGEGIIIRLCECNGVDTEAELRVLDTEFCINIPHDSIKTYLVKDGILTETDFLEL